MKKHFFKSDYHFSDQKSNPDPDHTPNLDLVRRKDLFRNNIYNWFPRNYLLSSIDQKPVCTLPFHLDQAATFSEMYRYNRRNRMGCVHPACHSKLVGANLRKKIKSDGWGKK